MFILSFTKEVHQNAVEHGFWETDQDIHETISLIHSEYSEALEEYRAGRPMYWRECYAETQRNHNGIVCTPGAADCPYIAQYLGGSTDPEKCHYRGEKPEGIAVELIDAVIRILDLFGKNDYHCEYATFEQLMQEKQKEHFVSGKTPLTTIIADCHSLTAQAGDGYFDSTYIYPKDKDKWTEALYPLETVIGIIMNWVKENGFDPEALMQEKYQYNRSRPYKHGKTI